MSIGLAPINRAMNAIPKRAEAQQAEQLRDTFVDSGVTAAIEAVDHQVLYGRRGTGKTHAFRYLETVVSERGDVAHYADLRTVGSPEGLFAGEEVDIRERAARLFVDLLTGLHDTVLAAALDDERLSTSNAFIRRLDALAEAITTVRVVGDVERSFETETSSSSKQGAGLSATLGGTGGVKVAADAQGEAVSSNRGLTREARHGTERIALNFADIAKALRQLTAAMSSQRLWILLDEWSSVPADLQPLLGEFLVRCVMPLQDSVTVKIAAIEQQTTFRQQLESGQMIGIEVGADVAANLDLDEFMVFEQNEERARSFFRGLLFKHLTARNEHRPDPGLDVLAKPGDVITHGFTDRRAFDELVRAAEGVPRDAINIAARAAMRAGASKISVPDVRQAARAWFQNDKEAALKGREDAIPLLNWIIDNVIRGKRARGFLVSQRSANAPLLLALFDARVLHVVRKGYSAQDEPTARYDVYVIDYGAYVDLIHTKSEPLGTLPLGADSDDEGAGYVEVPTQDLRAIRRAILDLNQFKRSRPYAANPAQAAASRSAELGDPFRLAR
jgi:hypothetical protein